MKRINWLFYKSLVLFIIIGMIPALLVGLRLPAYNRILLLAGGENWSAPPQAIEQISQALQTESLSYLIYSLITVSIFALFISGSLIQPMRKLRELVESFLEGDLYRTAGSAQMVVADGARPGESLPGARRQESDEVNELAASLQGIMLDLAKLRSDLELQVQERTQELEHRARLQQAAAAVAQDSASIRNLDALLYKVTQLIAENFEYYHVGIFLLDEKGEFAVLRASNSAGGRQMLVRGHKLNIAETSIVGHVASTRRPRVALSVGADAVHFKNPYLPDTRSEMALPLVTGRAAAGEDSIADSASTGQTERLWGVLDVQSQQEQAFTDEDIAVLQILANQVAIAIENAHLFIENQKAVAELQSALQTSRKLYGEMTGEAWRKLLQARPQTGYLAARSGGQRQAEGVEAVETTTASGEWQPEMLIAAQSGQSMQSDEHTLIIPIRMRDITAGVLRLSKEKNAPAWSRSEIELIHTLTEQLGVALESARLYDETRRRAERERLTGEITAKLRASNDPQVILKTAMAELRQALQASQARVAVHRVSGEAPLTNSGGVE